MRILTKGLVLTCTVALATAVNAQNNLLEKANELSESRYTRPSVTFVALSFSNAGIPFDVSRLYTDARFDFNRTSVNELKVPVDFVLPVSDAASKEEITSRENLYKSTWSSRTEEILRAIRASRIGNEILANILLDKSGRFSDSLVMFRSRNTTTDYEVLQASNLKNGQDGAVAKEMLVLTSLSQLSKIYLSCLSVIDIKELHTKSPYSTYYNSNGYVFWVKLDFEKVEPQIRKAIQESADLKNVISHLDLDWKLVYSSELLATSSESNWTAGKNPSNSQLYSNVPNVLMDAHKISLTSKIADFKPFASIYSLNPIGIKVGQKESVIKGQRWEVLEQFEKNQKLELKHRGYVRASKVYDNRGFASGGTQPTIFYQIQGKKLDRGMMAVRNEDAAITMRISYFYKVNDNIQSLRGVWTIESDLSLVQYLRGFKVGAIVQADRDNRITSGDNDILFGGLSVKQGLPLTRNFELELALPVLMGGIYENKNYLAAATQPSMNLNFNLGKRCQGTISVGYRWTLYNLRYQEFTPIYGGGIGLNF